MSDLIIDGVPVGSGGGDSLVALDLGDGVRNIPTGGRTPLDFDFIPILYVIVTAKAGNSVPVWAGGSTVSEGRGIPLSGSEKIRFDVDNLQDVWIAGAPGEGVTFTYGTSTAITERTGTFMLDADGNIIQDGDGNPILDSSS